MIRCIIVEDETLAQNVIQSHLQKTPGFELVGICNNALEATEALSKHDVDLIFLDVQLPGMTGLNFLRTLQNPPLVVLTTAYSEYALESYEFNVIDYLLKPIAYPRFLKAINKIAMTTEPQPLVEIPYPSLELKHEGILKTIATEHMLYIESIGNYIRIHFENAKPMLFTQTMKYMTSVLPSEYFTRVHKSYIVKRSRITEIRKTEVELNGNITIPVGRKYSVLLEQ